MAEVNKPGDRPTASTATPGRDTSGPVGTPDRQVTAGAGPGTGAEPGPGPGPGTGQESRNPGDAGALVDELPEDLDVTAFVGPYQFPDNSRRRLPGALYLAVGAVLVVVWALRSPGVLVNVGYLVVGGLLLVIGAYHFLAARSLKIREVDALTAAGREVGFPVGHASAQMAWRGLLSVPTWRILLYSAENPPRQRALVAVDGNDGHVIGSVVEDNPEEDWQEP